MDKLKEKNIFHANIFYLILGLLFVFFGSMVQAREVYSGLLITEYIIILIPNIIYLKSKGLSLKKTLKLKKINLKQMLYVLGITIFTYPIAVFLNLIVISILSSFGTIQANTAPIPDTPKLYLLSLFVISITPGICEEIMFRGTMMNAYENISKKKAIIYSAVLFGVFHLNIQNLLGPIFLGIIFGIVVYKTGSIYSSILGHALNNGIAITIGYLATKGQEVLLGSQEIPPEIEQSIQGVQMIAAILVIGVFALISFGILKKLLKGLPKGEDGEMIFLEEDKEKTNPEKNIKINDVEENIESTNIKELNTERSNSIKLLYYVPIFLFLIIFLYININFTYI